jgi:NDP-sugar pyrophosphorylase family protein
MAENGPHPRFTDVAPDLLSGEQYAALGATFEVPDLSPETHTVVAVTHEIGNPESARMYPIPNEVIISHGALTPPSTPAKDHHGAAYAYDMLPNGSLVFNRVHPYTYDSEGNRQYGEAWAELRPAKVKDATIGPWSIVEANTTVENSSVDATTVGKGSRILRAVVGEQAPHNDPETPRAHTALGEGVAVEESIVFEDSFVDRDSTITSNSQFQGSLGVDGHVYRSSVFNTIADTNVQFSNSQVGSPAHGDEQVILGEKVLVSDTTVSAGGRIEDKTKVMDSELDEGVHVGPNSELKDVKVRMNATLGAAVTATKVTLGAEAVTGAGSELTDANIGDAAVIGICVKVKGEENGRRAEVKEYATVEPYGEVTGKSSLGTCSHLMQNSKLIDSRAGDDTTIGPVWQLRDSRIGNNNILGRSASGVEQNLVTEEGVIMGEGVALRRYEPGRPLRIGRKVFVGDYANLQTYSLPGGSVVPAGATATEVDNPHAYPVLVQPGTFSRSKRAGDATLVPRRGEQVQS